MIRSGLPVGRVATEPLHPRGVPSASEHGGRIKRGPQVGKVATWPLPPRGSEPLQSKGQVQFLGGIQQHGGRARVQTTVDVSFRL